MDKKTAEKLYEAFYMKVFSYVMTLAKDRLDAEEITQETFFRAISTDKSFRGDSDSYTWLCAIAKNIFIDSKRHYANQEDEIPEELIKNSKIFHFGTLSMTHEGVREATKKALDVARNAGVMISFDPNLRPPLWDSLETAREQVLYGLGFCDVLKISDNEIEWLTGENDYTAGVEWIRERYNIPLILVSMGRDGSRAYYDGGSSKKIMVEEKAFLHENTVDTTGAGDTFFGCILHYLCRYDISELNETLLAEMLRFANAAASIVTTRKGALRVMPDVSEVKRLLKA